MVAEPRPRRRPRASGASAPEPRGGGLRRFWHLLAAAAVVPLAAALLLRAGGVPLGCPGRLVYLYSPIAAIRLAAVWPALLLAPLLGVGVELAARRPALGLGLAALAGAGLGVWAYRAPPYHVGQHLFNVHSPSHDGAFVEEALRIEHVRDYLRAFPQRARTPPERMRGTRVVSNPPGATLLAAGVERLLAASPALSELALRPVRRDLDPRLYRSAATGLVFLWVLTGLWLAAGVFLYLLARDLAGVPAAAACAACVVFGPMTLLFTPGKDPAQLLSVALPAWLWVSAWRRVSAWRAALAGVAGALACVASLVHVWIGAVLVAATLGAALREGGALWTRLARVLVPAAGAALLAVAGLRVVAGLDLPAAAWAVAGAQAAVTRGPDAMPLAAQALGVPLFLLLAGPAFWTLAVGALGPGRRGVAPAVAETDGGWGGRFGGWLLLGSAVVMLGTIGFTNVETPRLWIPFLPLVLLGALLRVPGLRRPGPGAVRLLAVLVCVQVVCSVLHWSLLDVRESETRLVEQRFFG